jgi:hypothetical protein
VVNVVKAFDEKIIGLLDVVVETGASVEKPPRDYTFFCNLPVRE